MLVPLWSLREDQNELVVIPGHLSLPTPLTTTGLYIGLHIADVLIMTAPGGDQMPGWIDKAPEAKIQVPTPSGSSSDSREEQKHPL